MDSEVTTMQLTGLSVNMIKERNLFLLCFVVFYYIFKVFHFLQILSFFSFEFQQYSRAVSIRCKILRICFSSVLIKNKQNIIIPRGYSKGS